MIPEDMFRAQIEEKGKYGVKDDEGKYKGLDYNNACIKAAYYIAPQYGIPDWLLFRQMKLESGFKVDAIGKNTDGSKDYGCGQINDKWHTDFFKTRKWDDADHNVKYMITLLTTHKSACIKDGVKPSNAWSCAALRYHSMTPSKQAAYERKLNQTQIARN
jgi:hypothetical protein